MRTCQCGGIIREQQKPYWDILPSCTCQKPDSSNYPDNHYYNRYNITQGGETIK